MRLGREALDLTLELVIVVILIRSISLHCSGDPLIMMLTVSFIVGLVQSNPTRVALEADVPLSKFSAGWVMGPRASPTAPFQLTVAVSERKKKTIKSYILLLLPWLLCCVFIPYPKSDAGEKAKRQLNHFEMLETMSTITALYSHYVLTFPFRTSTAPKAHPIELG